MEAASARYAARDRWGDSMAHTGPVHSQLQRYIHAACSPENYEPNLALSLEIADLINAKKGSAPREAAVTIVNLINHRNANVALLALNLLDMCVKNCGYPFHLQISTKEFLNELVRRFPERPPVRPTRVQLKILEAIEEWRGTICETSRHKEDLGFIRDMHRLLSYKGYLFPEVRREDAAVLNPAHDSLKSAEEMETEEREAQSAKLQELIRRGTPEDLQEANRLMKIMAGYDTRSKVDYRAKAAEEVSKIQQKARLLEERLEHFKSGDEMADGDVFSELASSLTSAQPKIQKMCEEESDDHEAVAKLLEINDSIHRTVERYKLMKKGDVESANRIAKGGEVTITGGSAQNELSLIDFDAEVGTNGAGAGTAAAAAAAAAAATAAAAAATAAAAGAAGAGVTQGSSSSMGGIGLETDLLGLTIGEGSSFGQTGGISLGFGANTNIPGPALLSSITQHNSARGPISSTAPTPPLPQGPSSSSPFPRFSSFSSALDTSQPSTLTAAPAPASTTSRPTSLTASGGSDLFAAFGHPSMSSNPISPAPPAAAVAAAATAAKPEDEEWSFSSALPPEAPAAVAAQTREHRATVSNTAVRIDMQATRVTAATNPINLVFSFTNNTAQPVSELHFQLAVTKGYDLQLKPQTGRNLEPKQSRGVTQAIEVWHAGDRSRKVESVKLRWRVGYRVGTEANPRAETGEIVEFSVA